MAINVRNTEQGTLLDVMPRTLVVNPYWSFKATNSLSNHDQWLMWSQEELMKLNMCKFIGRETLVVLMVTPTALATGKHLELLKSWECSPTTTGAFIFRKCMGAGNNRLNDSCMYFILANPSLKSIHLKKKENHVILPRHLITNLSEEALSLQENVELNDFVDEQEMPFGMGMTFGKGGYEYFEKLGNPPYMNVFPRGRQRKQIPDNWYIWSPDKRTDHIEGEYKEGVSD